MIHTTDVTDRDDLGPRPPFEQRNAVQKLQFETFPNLSEWRTLGIASRYPRDNMNEGTQYSSY